MDDAPSTPDPAPALCAIEEMEGRHGRVLQELAEIGMELARLVLGHALNETMGRRPPRPEADPQLAYTRLARAVRQTLALEARLREGAKARRESAEAERAAARLARGAARKSEVREAVERLIETEAGETEESLRNAERLLGALYEHLGDTPDADFAEISIGEAIAAICRELGLTPDWSLWKDAAWATAEGAEAPVAATQDDDPP